MGLCLQSEWFILGGGVQFQGIVLELPEYYNKSLLVVVDTIIIAHKVYNNLKHILRLSPAKCSIPPFSLVRILFQPQLALFSLIISL